MPAPDAAEAAAWAARAVAAVEAEADAALLLVCAPRRTRDCSTVGYRYEPWKRGPRSPAQLPPEPVPMPVPGGSQDRTAAAEAAAAAVAADTG